MPTTKERRGGEEERGEREGETSYERALWCLYDYVVHTVLGTTYNGGERDCSSHLSSQE